MGYRRVYKEIEGVTHLQCKSCKEMKPATPTFFTRWVNDKFFGIYGTCKECRNKQQNELYAKSAERRERVKVRAKIARENGYGKTYYTKNREILIQKACARQKKNREAIRERERIYRNTERGREVNRLKGVKRRSRLYRTKIDLPVSVWEDIQTVFQNANGAKVCAYCGVEVNKPSIEHFKPLAKGGGTTKNNILPVCLSCNCSKQDKPFRKWFQKQPFYDPRKELFILKYLRLA